jgi:hypothetical protein
MKKGIVPRAHVLHFRYIFIIIIIVVKKKGTSRTRFRLTYTFTIVDHRHSRKLSIGPYLCGLEMLAFR